jgi:Nif-specific regulatory protein
VETGEPAVVPRVSQEPLFLNRTRSRGSREKDELSFLCVPIKINYKTIGALSVDKLHRDLDLDRDLRLLTIIASIIAQTVNNLLLIDREKERLQNENLQLKGELQERYQMGNIIGTSGRMRQVFEMIERVAKSNATILIRGESGTGKEMVASALHYNSLRADKPFIKVNLAALPETLVESELFGHERGAFTGAQYRRKGKVELADGGTLFLDEIGNIDTKTQMDLLRVIETKQFTRVGGTEILRSDFRVVCATNKDLEGAVREGTFREDLYYRLNVFTIDLPPLRGRRGDIANLAHYFLEKFSRQMNKKVQGFSPEAMQALKAHDWPGNVRELENAVERAMVVVQGDLIEKSHLPLHAVMTGQRDGKRLEDIEQRHIEQVLRDNGWNVSRSAAILDIDRVTLYHKIEKFGLKREQ